MTEIQDDTAQARSTPTHPLTPDWGRGHYERTAKALVEAVVLAGKPRPGERVLDVGCGTGSVALIAARAGARVTGIVVLPEDAGSGAIPPSAAKAASDLTPWWEQHTR